MELALIAGGAGFIGSHLSTELLKKGYKVICIDNLITGAKENITSLLQNPDFTFIEKDVTEDLSSLSSELLGLKYVFHLASPASPNKKSPRSYINHPIETLMVNSLGTKNLLDTALKNNAQFLYASSSEIYGDPAHSPQSEDYFGNVNPNGPRSVYDEGKRFGEAITMGYVRKFRLNGRIIRIFNTYGPGMQQDDGRVVSNFITQAISNQPITIYGEGKQTRSFCYVDDMINGIMKAMFIENSAGEVINLGNPDERQVADLAKMVKEATQSTSEITFESMPQDDPSRRKPDITKAKTLLSWEPKVSIEEGLTKTIQYFKEKQ